MAPKLETFFQPFLKKDLPDIRPGDTVRIYQKIKEGEKEKTQTFEGLVLARKHGKEIGATIVVRKVISGIGVERIFPIHSPTIERIDILKRGKVRRAKLYYLRKAKGKKARLKKIELKEKVRLSDKVVAKLEKAVEKKGEKVEEKKEK
ncbi:50S ribosomal protein L19 [Patescibacteria group bacterium]|nr:50S ribosomal protein L19 [Patescibacteria group bacterium]